ncbi:MAG: hypothetical protein JXN59_05755 [Anaerolineae bacterium]|nr:hypothetical protein [Anaerolineae bacterium]
MPDQIKEAVERLSLNEEADDVSHARWEHASRSGYMAPPEVNRALARAEELITQGYKSEAQDILKNMRCYAEKNPRYWKTVLKSARNKNQARIALEHIISLRPRSEDAWLLLQKIDPAAAEQLSEKMDYRLHGIPRPKQRPRNHYIRRLFLFTILALILLIAFAFAINVLIPLL